MSRTWMTDSDSALVSAVEEACLFLFPHLSPFTYRPLTSHIRLPHSLLYSDAWFSKVLGKDVHLVAHLENSRPLSRSYVTLGQACLVNIWPESVDLDCC
jgi:hypothetical protein